MAPSLSHNKPTNPYDTSTVPILPHRAPLLAQDHYRIRRHVLGVLQRMEVPTMNPLFAIAKFLILHFVGMGLLAAAFCLFPSLFIILFGLALPVGFLIAILKGNR
jgi:hypothetical protein